MSFDRIAPYYSAIEKIFAGKKMQRARVAFLSNIPAPKKILLLGEGTGSFLTACRQQFPEASVTCLDASAGMLQKMRTALHHQKILEERIIFLHENIFAWQPTTHEYDLIVSHFFLDCFTQNEVEQLLPKIASTATPDASWLIADFQIPHAWFMKKIAFLLVKILLLFFKAITNLSATELIPLDSLLKKSGFSLKERKKICGGILKSDWWINIASQ